MKSVRVMFGTSFASLLVLAGVSLAETKVELKGVHLCCPACVKGVTTALKDVEGVTPACDRAKKTVTLTATDDKAAQKALDALGEAGYHGDTGNAALAIKNGDSIPAGTVKSVTVTGVHNCCGSCTRAIKAAVKTVEGVSADTLKAKETSFEVTGDFNAADLVKALHTAGFHVRIK